MQRIVESPSQVIYAGDLSHVAAGRCLITPKQDQYETCFQTVKIDIACGQLAIPDYLYWIIIYRPVNHFIIQRRLF